MLPDMTMTFEPGGGVQPGRADRVRAEEAEVPDGLHRACGRAGAGVDRVVLRPGGRLQDDPEAGGPVPGQLPRAAVVLERRRGRLCVETAFDQRLKQLWIATPNGLYGIENDRGFVSADEAGVLYGSAMIFLFVLAVGAFITVTMKTGAIQTGIGRLALRFRHSGSVLIAMLMASSRSAGPRYGMWEETLGFFVLLVPLDARARLRPHRRGVDHLPRRRNGRDRSPPSTLSRPASPPTRPGSASATASALRIAMWIVLVPLAIALRRPLRESRTARTRGTVNHMRLAGRMPRTRSGLIDDVPALTGRQKITLSGLLRGVPHDDLRVHPMERPVGHVLRHRLAAPDLRQLLLHRSVDALPRRRRSRSASSPSSARRRP